MASSKPTRPAEPEVVDEAKEPVVATKPSATQAKKASGKMVKHLPHELFSARVITRENWESIGVYEQEGVEWNSSNGFQLPVEMFTDGALAYLTQRDDGFEIVDG